MDGTSEHTLLITTDTVGGVWSFSISLAEALSGRNVKVILAALGPLPTDRQKLRVRRSDHIILEAFESKLEWMEDPWDSIEEAGQWLTSLASKYRPDVVHCNHYAHTHLDYQAAVVLTMHSCVKTWWKAVKEEEAPYNWTKYGEMVQRAIHCADRIVVPTQAILDAYKKEYAGMEEAMVIYNGVKLNNYYSATKEPFIFSMGRLWDEGKNIELLTQAAKNIDFPIYIAGNGENLADASMPDNVHFLGWQSDEEIRDWLSRASLYVLPVKYEPFGLSFLEAAASGCAIIGGKTDSLEEIWGDAALYTVQDETSALAKLINVMMKDKMLLNEMRHRCLKKATQYSLKSTANAYYELYKSLNLILSV